MRGVYIEPRGRCVGPSRTRSFEKATRPKRDLSKFICSFAFACVLPKCCVRDLSLANTLSPGFWFLARTSAFRCVREYLLASQQSLEFSLVCVTAFLVRL